MRLPGAISPSLCTDSAQASHPLAAALFFGCIPTAQGAQLSSTQSLYKDLKSPT
jgi:hypothetical protein